MTQNIKLLPEWFNKKEITNFLYSLIALEKVFLAFFLVSSFMMSGLILLGSFVTSLTIPIGLICQIIFMFWGFWVYLQMGE